MGQMLIRNIDESVVLGLKRRAAQNRTSAEEEARRVLAADLGFDAAAVQAKLKALRDEIGPLPGPDSTALLRADRDRDEQR